MNWDKPRIYLAALAVIVLPLLAACQAAIESESEPAEAIEAAPAEAVGAAPVEEVAAESSLKLPEASLPAIFSLDDASSFPPDDIIPAVGYFGGAEPGFCDPMSVELKPRQVSACPADQVEQMDFLALMMDGLHAGEAVTLTTTLPDAIQISQTLTASPDGAIRFEFVPDLANPVGEYHFNFMTSLGDLDKSITIVEPSQPRLYLLPEESSLILRAFNPNEFVRLFLYGAKPGTGLVLRGWTEYQVDDQGSLRIEYPELDEPHFYIVGEESGLVPYREKGAASLREMWPGGDIACPGAPQPLSITFDTTVAVSAPRVLAEIESFPDVFSFPIPQGTNLKLEEFWGAPRCEDRMIWWTVECPRLSGLDCKAFTRVWVPEGRGNAYYLQPSRP